MGKTQTTMIKQDIWIQLESRISSPISEINSKQYPITAGEIKKE